MYKVENRKKCIEMDLMHKEIEFLSTIFNILKPEEYLMLK